MPRSGGRRARQALRAAPPKTNPAPHGQIGGQYKPLREDEIEAIYDTALRLLEELGIEDKVPTIYAHSTCANLKAIQYYESEGIKGQ